MGRNLRELRFRACQHAQNRVNTGAVPVCACMHADRERGPRDDVSRQGRSACPEPCRRASTAVPGTTGDGGPSPFYECSRQPPICSFSSLLATGLRFRSSYEPGSDRRPQREGALNARRSYGRRMPSRAASTFNSSSLKSHPRRTGCLSLRSLRGRTTFYPLGP